jgi:oxygen-independent coproporphyrinogen-3 oxidase
VDTIFLGGGTPTHLSEPQLARLLELVARWFPTAADYEWSVEANPADLTPAKAELLASRGVNRISLGAQSFQSDKLKQLDRDHQAEHIEAAAGFAKQHFQSVSLDLIFGAPGETQAGWEDDLAHAIRLRPDHVSTYGLTYERGTRFWSLLNAGRLAALGEDLEREMYAAAIDRLAGAGFEHYEVSNFAQPGHRCRHNETYWTGSGYYAVGPGAARYIDGRREVNHRSTTTYLKRVLAGQSPVAEQETLPPADAARETLVFGLRRLEGVRRDWFARHSGFEPDALVGESLRKYVQLGMLADDGTTIRLTRAGLFVSDAIWPDFLSGT